MDAEAKKILGELKVGKYAPFYVLQGEETYYIDLIADYIEANVLTESEKGFNQVVLYGKDANVATILTHAKRYPMMSERQVVIVREAQEIIDLQKEMGSKLLLDYVTNPTPSTILVLCHKHKSLDKRRELGKMIAKLAVAPVFKKPYENHLPEFVKAYVKENKLTIDDAAVRVLCEYVGNDLKRLANELDKVMIDGKEAGTITADQIMSQVGISREYNIFELQKALVNRDPMLSNKIVNYFESNTKKNPLIPVVAYLYSFYSKLLMASAAPSSGDKSLVNLLKISPYVAKDYSNALQNYSSADLIRCISAIAEADLKLKGVNSSAIGEGQILRELVYKLIH
ncbi:MAG TPA: DNA polymerase III subunit delta [Cyclobacteriaceae bacterium]